VVYEYVLPQGDAPAVPGNDKQLKGGLASRATASSLSRSISRPRNAAATTAENSNSNSVVNKCSKTRMKKVVCLPALYENIAAYNGELVFPNVDITMNSSVGAALEQNLVRHTPVPAEGQSSPPSGHDSSSINPSHSFSSVFCSPSIKSSGPARRILLSPPPKSAGVGYTYSSSKSPCAGATMPSLGSPAPASTSTSTSTSRPHRVLSRSSFHCPPGAATAASGASTCADKGGCTAPDGAGASGLPVSAASSQAKDVILQLLRPAPADRFTARQLVDCSWLASTY
jgi:hypothetical protein